MSPYFLSDLKTGPSFSTHLWMHKLRGQLGISNLSLFSFSLVLEKGRKLLRDLLFYVIWIMSLFLHSQNLENFKLGIFVLKIIQFHLTPTKINQVPILHQVSCLNYSQWNKLGIIRQSHNAKDTDVCKVLGKHWREGAWGLGKYELYPGKLLSPFPADLIEIGATSSPNSHPPVTIFSRRRGVMRSLPCTAGWHWDSLFLFHHSSDVEVSFPGAGGRSKRSREKCLFSLFGERIYHILWKVNRFWIHLAAFLLGKELLCG